MTDEEGVKFINYIEHVDLTYLFNERPVDLRICEEAMNFIYTKLGRTKAKVNLRKDKEFNVMLKQIRTIIFESGLLKIKGVREFFEIPEIFDNSGPVKVRVHRPRKTFTWKSCINVFFSSNNSFIFF
jgi:hypothetical protein